jgi:large subunit ribosomal protein L32e
MTSTKTLLELRKKIKKSKPTFVVKESKFSAKVKSRWRFPRGKHSATRQYHKGRPKLVHPGYGSPKAVKHLHHSGLKTVLVSNTKDLSNLDAENEGALIASTVSNRSKLVLLKLAKDKKITVFNYNDQSIEKIESEFAQRKKLKEEKLKDKGKKQEEKKKKAEIKKNKESEDDKKDSADVDAKIEDVEKAEKERQDQQKTVEKEIIKKQ